MDQIARNALKKALDLVRAAKYDRARPILIELLKEHPNLEQAWFLLSFTLPEGERQIYALRQALKVNPEYQRARERLAKLSGDFGDGESVARFFGEPAPAAAADAPEPPRVVEAAPDEAGEEELAGGFDEAKDPERRPRAGLRTMLIVLLLLVLVVSAYIFVGDWIGQQLAGFSLVQSTATAISTRALPATFTPQSEREATPTPSALPSLSPTPAAFNFPTPDEATQARMEGIQQEVLALRGLGEAVSVDHYIVSRDQAVAVLESLYMDADRSAQIDQEEAVLAALGLIPAVYSLIDYEISRQADQLFGFYEPALVSIFLIGEDFSGVAPYGYAHLYEQALADHHVDLAGQIPEEGCSILSDACRAMLALVKGEATYLSNQWAQSFGDEALTEALAGFALDQMLVQGQAPPPFIPADLGFAYAEGARFAEALVAAGGWSGVDSAYRQPPSSTEQILHPEKYMSGEAPAPPDAVDLGPVLGRDWQPLLVGSLGEWLTYQLLFQGADEGAWLPVEIVQTASFGWAGDRVQSYQRTDGAVLLASHYAWDTPADAGEWTDAMGQYLDARYLVSPADFEGGQCWEAAGVVNCLFADGEQTLWLQGPGLDLLGEVLARFDAFQ